MSIFLEQHHDTLLLEYLSIDDIAKLSQVNRYYRNLTKGILQPFRQSYKSSLNWNIKQTIYIDKPRRHIKFDQNALRLGGYYFVRSSIYVSTTTMQQHDRIRIHNLIKACRYGNTKVIEYYCKKSMSFLTHIIETELIDNQRKIIDDCYPITVIILSIYVCIAYGNIAGIETLCSQYIPTNLSILISVLAIRYYVGDSFDDVISIIKKCKWLTQKIDL